MLIAMDVGNTNIKVGAFRGADLIATWRIATDARRTSDEYGVLLLHLLRTRDVEPSVVEQAVLCSVVPRLTGVLGDTLRVYFNVSPLVVGEGIKSGIRILYDNPQDVGADRIVAAAAAYHLYGGPVITVEFGTASVFNGVTRTGDFLGGAIHPGLQVAAESLFANTSQLRRIELARPAHAIGRSTIEAIQSGVVLGHVALVEGMVGRFQRELGDDARVVATGGLARLIADATNVFTAVNEDLLMHGLQIINTMNRAS